MKKTFPKAEEELAGRFDAGEDLESLGFDVINAQVEEPRVKRVNVDFPEHMLAMLDREAELRGINRQALIKTWLYEGCTRPRNERGRFQKDEIPIGISEAFQPTREGRSRMIDTLRRRRNLFKRVFVRPSKRIGIRSRNIRLQATLQHLS